MCGGRGPAVFSITEVTTEANTAPTNMKSETATETVIWCFHTYLQPLCSSCLEGIMQSIC